MLREADPITHTWLRLRNTGRAPALDVSWSLIDTRRTLLGDTGSLAVIYPGEYYDLRYITPMGADPDPTLVVEWTDGNGPHATERLLSI